MDILRAILASPEFTTFLIGLVTTVLTSVFAFVGTKLRALLDSKLTIQQREILLQVARQAVQVAEQMGVGKLAEEKKAQAEQVASAYLAAYGIKVSAAELDAAIEAAVFTELTQWKDPISVEETTNG